MRGALSLENLINIKLLLSQVYSPRKELVVRGLVISWIASCQIFGCQFVVGAEAEGVHARSMVLALNHSLRINRIDQARCQILGARRFVFLVLDLLDLLSEPNLFQLLLDLLQLVDLHRLVLDLVG